MGRKQSIPAIISCNPRSLEGQFRACSLAARLTVGVSVALSAVIAMVSSATAQELEWVTSAGGTSFEDARGIAADARGNSYVTGGSNSSPAIFGAGEDNETVFTAGVFFIAKYARSGQLLWAKTADGSAAGEGIATNAQANSYVTGEFGGPVVKFGAGEDNETVLTAPNGIFVAKYDRDGRLLWATGAGPAQEPNSSSGRGIATDGRGDTYATGHIGLGESIFGAGEDNETVLNSASHETVFIAKYDRNGRLLWAKNAAGNSSGGSGGEGIAVDAQRNSYVTGAFGGTVTFGAGEANETALESVGIVTDLFVAKYARDGRLLWATKAGGAFEDVGKGIATDRQGNSYVTGLFLGSATFGAGEDNETVLTAPGGIFVAKYDRDGRLLWATNAEGIGFGSGQGIATDNRGDSYVTGRLGDFGGEDNEVFVAKYDRNGLLLWATKGGHFHFLVSEGGQSIATDGRGNSYVAGSFTGTATFGAGEANETTLDALGSADVFIAKYGSLEDQDQCPASDRRATVVLDGNDTGVDNVLTDTEGCTILDLILQAAVDAANRTDFVRSVALLTRTLLRDGLITAEEAGIIRTAASQATFPLS